MFSVLSGLVHVPTAVRTGNLAKFNQVLDQFADKFQADGTYTLIIRLRHNVIKTGKRPLLSAPWGSDTPSYLSLHLSWLSLASQ